MESKEQKKAELLTKDQVRKSMAAFSEAIRVNNEAADPLNATVDSEAQPQHFMHEVH
jgi:hypothetical protein